MVPLFLYYVSSALHLPPQYLLHYLCLWIFRYVSAKLLNAVGYQLGYHYKCFYFPFFPIFICLKTNKSPTQFFYIVCKLQTCFMSMVSFALLCLGFPLLLSFPQQNTITFSVTFLSLPVPFSCLYLKIAVVVVTAVVMLLDGPRIWRLLDTVTLWSPLWGGTGENCHYFCFKSLRKSS